MFFTVVIAFLSIFNLLHLTKSWYESKRSGAEGNKKKAEKEERRVGNIIS
jgi:hypothetical protein